MALIELSMILVYMCVLLIKSCDMSPALCSTFGFGTTAGGVYVFFIFFGLSMLLVLLVANAIKLYLT
eukprot:7383624-Prymnesium_polylepis.1